MLPGMSECLIVTTLADEFAAEVGRLSTDSIPVRPCTSAQQAIAAYDDHTMLFGSPGMLVECLPHMPKVTWVQSSWAGVTPLIELGRRDYQLTGVKGVFGRQMAEYVIGHLLAHELRIVERHAAQRRREWLGTFSGTVENKRLAILGTGSIGAEIASAGKCLAMHTVGVSRSGNPRQGFDQVYPVTQLAEVLDSADYLVSTLPQTPETDRLLDAEALARLPAAAYLINVGRSNVMDHTALVSALEQGALAGATLDVFDKEPLPADSPLWDAPNLIVTAHVAAVSHPLLIVPIFVENYRRFVTGKPLREVIDFDKGY